MSSAQPECIRRFAHGGDAERDVFLYRHGQFLGAFAHIVAIHAASKRLVFQLALYRVGFDFKDALARA